MWVSHFLGRCSNPDGHDITGDTIATPSSSYTWRESLVLSKDLPLEEGLEQVVPERGSLRNPQGPAFTSGSPHFSLLSRLGL